MTDFQEPRVALGGGPIFHSICLSMDFLNLLSFLLDLGGADKIFACYLGFLDVSGPEKWGFTLLSCCYHGRGEAFLALIASV